MKKTSYQSVKEWRRNTKIRMFEAFGSKCAVCSLVDDPIVFDFHHLDDSAKEFTIASITKKWEVMVEEAKKCVMLCCPCHRKHHAGMIDIPADAPRFDERLIKSVRQPNVTSCPVCSSSMNAGKKTCSRKCSAQKLYGLDWEAVDLPTLMSQHGSAEKVGELLNVSGTSVRKRMKALGIKHDGRKKSLDD